MCNFHDRYYLPSILSMNVCLDDLNLKASNKHINLNMCVNNNDIGTLYESHDTIILII